jgi:hypothetical protein
MPGGEAKLQLSYEPREQDVLADLKVDIDRFDYGVIGRRLKQTGARWKVRRVNRMAGLCSIMYSDLWKTYWNALS